MKKENNAFSIHVRQQQINGAVDKADQQADGNCFENHLFKKGKYGKAEHFFRSQSLMISAMMVRTMETTRKETGGPPH